jgi:hypothetical protein
MEVTGFNENNSTVMDRNDVSENECTMDTLYMQFR